MTENWKPVAGWPSYEVHRLVAEAFLGASILTVSHDNGNTTDWWWNHLEQ